MCVFAKVDYNITNLVLCNKTLSLRNSQAIACLVFMVLNSHLYDVNFLCAKVWLIRLVGLKGLRICLYIYFRKYIILRYFWERGIFNCLTWYMYIFNEKMC